MNGFRESLQAGKGRNADQPLVTAKRPRSPGGKGLEKVAVARNAQRSADHRDADRHRLIDRTATLIFRGQRLTVDLFNLSGGGAMIRGGFAPNMWEQVKLTLGKHGTVECAVRWIRGDSVGLEFANETRIDGDAAARDAMLLEVIRESFPDMLTAATPDQVEDQVPADHPPQTARRGEPRHPMIWSGHVHFNHGSVPVRLRNVSPRGALIESPLAYPAGAELYLDLGNAGSLFATVSWSRGDQVGLTFAETFDIASLSKARPILAAQRWSAPPYMRDDQGDSSPWAKRGGRASVDEPEASLDGLLKL